MVVLKLRRDVWQLTSRLISDKTLFEHRDVGKRQLREVPLANVISSDYSCWLLVCPSEELAAIGKQNLEYFVIDVLAIVNEAEDFVSPAVVCGDRWWHVG